MGEVADGNGRTVWRAARADIPANDEALVQIDGHTNRTTPLPDGIACFREPKRRHSK
ncbi:hypothetical protein I552_5867 [Mycobacterium xenopi 3993]|nr:hypothetical protein I552_5867 [Mycobacterium xenopi 3993]